MVSKDWKSITLGEFISLQRGYDLTEAERTEGTIPVVGSSGVNGWHNEANVKGPGVTLGRSGASFGVAFYCPTDFWAHNTVLYVTDFHGNDEKFTYYFLDFLDFRAYNSGGAQPSLNRNFIYPIEIVIPPLPEQRAIAAILSTWDEAITLTEALIEALQQRKQALMQLLLTGEVRFEKFEGDEWDEIKIGSFLKESRIPGSNGAKAHKLTVKLYGRGVKAKDEPKLGSENTVYYKRKAGQFIYSKLDFLNGAFGIIPSELDGFETTLDLPTFDISPIVNSILFLKYVSRESFYQSFLESALGGRKAKRVQPSELLSKKIKLPSIEEQNQIAEVINLLEEEESTLTRYFETIQVQKRALMQQLLTGAVRVQGIE